MPWETSDTQWFIHEDAKFQHRIRWMEREVAEKIRWRGNELVLPPELYDMMELMDDG